MMRKELKVWLPCIVVLAVTFLAYKDSLQHTARADQLLYLYGSSSMQDLYSLTIGSHNFNRTVNGDFIVYRPILYFLLGFQKWLYQYNFVYWQLTSLMLHLSVVATLFAIIKKYNNTFVSACLTAFFAVQLSSMEMVVWHHISGYLLFSIFMLWSFWFLLGNAKFSKLAMFIFLLLGAFTYEFGNLVAIIFAVYMFANNILADICREKDNLPTEWERHKYSPLTIFSALAVPLIYGLASFIDLSSYVGVSPGGGFFQQPLLSNLIDGLMIAGHYIQVWINFSVNPYYIDLSCCGRIEFSGYAKNVTWLEILSVPFYSSLLIMLMQKNWHTRIRRSCFLEIALLGLLILAYSSMIAFGRGLPRGAEKVLFNNAYYTYICSLLFVLILNFIFVNFQFANKRAVKISGWIVLLFLLTSTTVSYNKVSEMNYTAKDWSRPLNNLVGKILLNIKNHGSEPDYSFAVDEACAGNAALTWWHLNGHVATTVEVLFPQHYQPNGKYVIRCP